MQPAPPERDRFLHAVVSVLLGIMAVVGAGCSDPEVHTDEVSSFGPVDTIAATTPARDSILALLDEMNRAEFDSAFVRLDRYAVSRYVRTEQLDTSGAVTAYRSLTLEYPADAGQASIRRADSVGTFREGGFLSGITPSANGRSAPENLATEALADQPAFLAPRTREAYRYALDRDSLFDGTPTLVIDAKARSSGRGADQSIRFARLTIHWPSLELVGLTVVRASHILLFRENSLITLRLRRAPGLGGSPGRPSDGTVAEWVPHLTRFRALVDVPFRLPRQFRTVSAYYGYSAR